MQCYLRCFPGTHPSTVQTSAFDKAIYVFPQTILGFFSIPLGLMVREEKRGEGKKVNFKCVIGNISL